MSADNEDAALEGWRLTEDWSPTFGRADVERFKWAWNEAEGELVWRVSGPGDGRPFHGEQVQQAWGREPSTASGDVFGTATYAPPTGREGALLSICAYFGARVPTSVMRWFQEAFPDAELRQQPDS